MIFRPPCAAGFVSGVRIPVWCVPSPMLTHRARPPRSRLKHRRAGEGRHPVMSLGPRARHDRIRVRRCTCRDLRRPGSDTRRRLDHVVIDAAHDAKLAASTEKFPRTFAQTGLCDAGIFFTRRARRKKNRNDSAAAPRPHRAACRRVRVASRSTRRAHRCESHALFFGTSRKRFALDAPLRSHRSRVARGVARMHRRRHAASTRTRCENFL
jgi:hypothetical protein